MDNNSLFGVEDIYQEYNLRQREKREIRRCALYIGAAYLVMLFLPDIVMTALIDLADIFGFTSQFVKLYYEPAFSCLVQIVLSIIAFTVPFAFLLYTKEDKGRDLLLFHRPKKGEFWPYVLVGVGFCGAGNLATNAISSFFSLFGITFTQYEPELPSGVFGAALIILSSVVTPALVEEFAMRGAVMGSMRKFGESFAIIGSAVLFAAMHRNFVQIPFAFIVGLGLGYATIKSGSIFAGITIHFINNLYAYVLNTIMGLFDFVLLQSAVGALGFALLMSCLFVGLLLMKKQGSEVWKLAPAGTYLSTGKKLICFFTSPIIIISLVITFVSALKYVII